MNLPQGPALDALLKKMREILQQNPECDALHEIEAYSRLFSDWFSGANLSEQDFARSDIQELVSGHAQVLEMARTVLGETSVARRELQQRAKVVISYLDVLPKRISAHPVKKG